MSTGKYTSFDSAPDSSHNLVVSLVTKGARVLEFGCATGYMSSVLKSRLGCSVIGVEVVEPAADLARIHCDRVIVADAEQLDVEQEFGAERFDAILFADVLEHLRDPGALLRRVRPLLAEGGAVVASIPNIAHGSVRLALLAGEFRYRELGLLDETHLRFFTRASLQDLFEGAGYVVTDWRRRRLGVGETEVAPACASLPAGVLEWVAQDPEATTYQFVVRAVPAEAAAELRHLRTRLAEAKAQFEHERNVREVLLEIITIVPAGESLVLVDQDEWGLGDTIAGRRRLQFPEHDGVYWGPPPDDETAIRELERLRAARAAFLAITWPAFWWLDYYAGFREHLRSNYRCLSDSKRLLMFDLRRRAARRTGRTRGHG